MKYLLILIGGVLLFVLFKPETSPANKKSVLADNFEVKISRFYKQRDYIRLTGYTINKGNRPAGAQIKLTCLDKKGEIVTVKDFWPDGIKNVQPGEKSAFAYMFEYIPGIDRYEYEIKDARSW